MAGRKAFRHRVTEIVRDYPESLGRVFSDLEEVDEKELPCITCQPAPAEVATASAALLHDEAADNAGDKEDDR